MANPRCVTAANRWHPRHAEVTAVNVMRCGTREGTEHELADIGMSNSAKAYRVAKRG
jgi:hypothetical protein